MGSASVEPRRLKHKLVDFALRVNLSHDCRPRVGLGSPGAARHHGPCHLQL
jgi:hypothetical protein